MRTAYIYSIYSSVVPIRDSVWIPSLIPESCYKTVQEITVKDVPKCVRTFKYYDVTDSEVLSVDMHLYITVK